MPTPPPRFLVTAGNTREAIDRVRDWGNIFTGQTGYRIAQALARLGPVDLLTSNREHLADLAAQSTPQRAAHRIEGHAFVSHAELKALLESRMADGRGSAYSGVFMTAAVADYRPTRVYAVLERRPMSEAEAAALRAGDASGHEVWIVRDAQAGKVKSTHDAIAVLGERTEKLVDRFRTAWSYRGLLVKFKLEVGLSREELLSVGEASRRQSGADFLVANTLDMVKGPEAGAFLLGGPAPEWVPRELLAEKLLKLAQSPPARA